jgi:CheY-like chemotaxis protein
MVGETRRARRTVLRGKTMRTKPRIVFIDDERTFLLPYELELENAGFDVVRIYDIDDADRYLDAEAETIDCVILDIMMPPGSLLREEDTQGGLATGERYLERLRTKFPSIPIIIFTNRAPHLLARETTEWKDISIRYKYHTLPETLVALIKSRLGNER